MASDRWQYDRGVKRYRDTDTGKFLPNATILRLRDEFVEARRVAAADLAGQLARGDLSLQGWERAMRDEIRLVFGAEYAFGRGGRGAMTPTDWGHVGALAKDQYTFLRGFAEAVARGELTEAQIAARAGLYAGSAVQAYERGRAAAFGLALPAYPADGGTECLSSCRCSWSIVETAAEYRATWKLDAGAGDNCAGCRGRAAAYAPLVVVKAA